MSHNPHHEHLMKEMEQMFAPLFKKSPQAIYLYLDDEHKICNSTFAKMLGYKNTQDWMDNPYPVDDVVKEDQSKAIKAYMTASEKLTATMLEGRWKTKKGKAFNTTVIMVPLVFQGETFVLHYISPKK